MVHSRYPFRNMVEE